FSGGYENERLCNHSEQYSGSAEGMAGRKARSRDSAEIYDRRGDIYGYGRPYGERILYKAQGRQDVRHFPGKSGRSSASVRTLRQRRKRHPSSRILLRFKRNAEQYADCRTDAGREISGG